MGGFAGVRPLTPCKPDGLRWGAGVCPLCQNSGTAFGESRLLLGVDWRGVFELMIITAVASPPVVVVLISIIAAMAENGREPSKAALFVYAGLFGFAGCVASLIWTILWMSNYESRTGYSAGNAPIGWLFFYGPLSFAAGGLAAIPLWIWRRTKGATMPGSHASGGSNHKPDAS